MSECLCHTAKCVKRWREQRLSAAVLVALLTMAAGATAQDEPLLIQLPASAIPTDVSGSGFTVIGEDLYINNFSGGARALRSASNPQAFGNPDHYSNRYLGTEDNGGVHVNSTIPTHAFYLFVQGGTNRTSGIRVGGIGLDNIERAEKIFYRAFTLYLGPTSHFHDAREATIQSAIDLYGWVATEVPQLTAAWDAVGVR